MLTMMMVMPDSFNHQLNTSINGFVSLNDCATSITRLSTVLPLLPCVHVECIDVSAFAAQAREPITITLTNGSERKGTSWETTPLDVAKEVSKSLSERAVIAKVL